MTLEDQPVETGQLALNPLLMDDLERGHGPVASSVNVNVGQREVQLRKTDGASPQQPPTTERCKGTGPASPARPNRRQRTVAPLVAAERSAASEAALGGCEYAGVGHGDR